MYEEVINENVSEEDDSAELNSPISDEEIKYVIQRYKSSGKSFDNQGFQPEMFKHFKNNSLKLLQKIFNLCLKKKIWIWENAEVIFLKKAGKKSYSSPGSYRPISITSYIGKLLESIVANRFKKFLLKKNHHDPDQEGFTEGKNTIRYLNRLHMGIQCDLKQGKTCICLS